MRTKICSRCKTEQPANRFPMDNGRRRSPCNKCRVIAVRNWRKTGKTHEKAGEFPKKRADGFLRCPRCGEYKPTSEYGVDAGAPSGLSSRCKACARQRSAEHRVKIRSRWLFAKGLARRRGLRWSISLKDYTELLSSPCDYCGLPLNKTGVGLDRVVNSKGYAKDNVVPACLLCNRTKWWCFNYEEMKLLGRVIREIRERRGDRLA